MGMESSAKSLDERFVGARARTRVFVQIVDSLCYDKALKLFLWLLGSYNLQGVWIGLCFVGKASQGL